MTTLNMKTRPSFVKIAFIAILISACLPTDALALFGRQRSRLLKQADQTYEEAQKAGSEGRVLDEIKSLSTARSLYGRILEEHPKYKTTHVDARFRRCGAHLRVIATRIQSGEITIPDPDTIMQGGGEGYVSAKAIPPPEPSLPGYRSEIPALVDTAALSLKPEDVAPKENTPTQAAARTQPTSDFSKKMPSPAAQARQATNDETDTSHTQSPIEQASDSMRIRLIHELIATRKATEAVFLLESLIEKEGEKASETTRLLFVRVLLECRNYRRATSELVPLVQAQSPSPAARSLASAIALQQNNLPEAMYQMDRLLQDYPAYSDAYINMAYLYYLMNPKTNRDMAIVCYRSGLAYGAQRDPAFETALGVEIVN